MNVSVVIATCGSQSWADLARSRAYPSVAGQLDTADCEAVVRHYPQLGLADARNAAAADAKGEWLCFLDADDELEPGYIAAMWDAIDRNPGVIWEDDERWEELWVTPPLFVPAVRYVGPPSRSPTVPQIPNRGRWPELNECVIGSVVQRDLFRRLDGFRSQSDDGTELTLYEDWDLFLRCYDVVYDGGSDLIYVEDAVYRAHVSPGGRNQGADARVVYDAIWRDHLDRVG